MVIGSIFNMNENQYSQQRFLVQTCFETEAEVSLKMISIISIKNVAQGLRYVNKNMRKNSNYFLEEILHSKKLQLINLATNVHLTE